MYSRDIVLMLCSVEVGNLIVKSKEDGLIAIEVDSGV